MQTLATINNLKRGLITLDLGLGISFLSSAQNTTTPRVQREENQLVINRLTDTEGMFVYNAAYVHRLSLHPD